MRRPLQTLVFVGVFAAFAGAGFAPAAWSQQALAPVPAAPTSGPAAVAAQPAPEEAFLRAVEDGRQTFASGVNDMARGVARPRRAEALCRAVPRGRIENWTGRLAVLGSSTGGRGVIVIEVAPRVTIATNRAEAADERDKTLIDVRSPLFAYVAALAVGDRVQFSGTFVSAADDCFKEAGRDTRASLTEPEFIFRLDAIRKVVPPPVSAVLSGQAAPMSIAQSSDFVRDAVDTIAGATVCGAEQRRVFGVIIKLLIRATAGQSTEQRDALIGLMFSPPSPQTQLRENCDARLSALDRLEGEVS